MRSGIARTLCRCGRRPLAGRLQHAGKFANPFDGEYAKAPTPMPRRRRPKAAPTGNRCRRRSARRLPPNRACSAAIRTTTLSLGKKQYRANNFGLAEKYFRHAVELHPRDAEAWLGLGRLLRPAAPLRSRRPRLRAGHQHRRADGRDPEQPGLFLHAARRLQARAREARPPPSARIPATNTCRTICSCWKTATARARPSSRPGDWPRTEVGRTARD